jgi:2-polyprenyl-3-methyl-5-hydroxy-6-metoxy-1,4-benzoquinol methylase
MTIQMNPDATAEERRDALLERLFASSIATMDIVTAYVGDRLGLYRSIHDHGPITSVDLAARLGLDERYVREWLEQQAVTGILAVDDVSAGPGERQYSLPDGHDEVLLAEENPNYLAPFARMLVACTLQIPRLVSAFRTGDGVGWEDYGDDMREAQAAINRPAFMNSLVTDWFGAVPDLDGRLRSDPPARIADVACGFGWSSIAMARGYPQVEVTGLDLDEPSIEAARRNAAASGVSGDRLRFEVRDAADPALAGRFDLVTIFEALHDMSHPVEALRAAHALLVDGGSVVVADERVAESFTAPGDEVERIMYGWSVLTCLPGGRTAEGSAATGTVMRPSTLRAYAAAAGFSRVEILPIENDFFRFYRLWP